MSLSQYKEPKGRKIVVRELDMFWIQIDNITCVQYVRKEIGKYWVALISHIFYLDPHLVELKQFASVIRGLAL